MILRQLTKKQAKKLLGSFLLVFFMSILIMSCKKAADTETETMTEEQLIAKAKGIHDRVITLDTHCDINVKNFTDSINYTQRLASQVNLPKMIEGGLDVPWFIVYTGQDSLTKSGYVKAYENAMSKFDAIHKLCNDIAPNLIELAVNSDDVRRINAKGKKVAMIGIENGYPIGLDINNVKKFYDLGARYMSLSHNGHSQLCDSHTGETEDDWLHNGVSDLGKEVIKEMNKYGMMIDVSHPSKESMKQMIELSKAPIIASHSSARALCGHSRNLDDEQLELMKQNGGVVQTVAFTSYLNTKKDSIRTIALRETEKAVMDSLGVDWMPMNELMKLLADKSQKDYVSTYFDMKGIVKKKAKTMTDLPPAVSVLDFVDHIDYMVDKIGLKHVGISSDFDGGGGIDGWSDASETFNVTLELVRRGYTEEEISLLWSGNLLRVLDECEAIAKELQS